MSTKTVTTQEELDAALAAGTDTIYIDSPDGVWLSIGATGSAHVVAWDSAHVEAWGSAHVEARGSAHVEAWGSAHVVAWGSAHVEAWGSAHVEAWGSAHVVARPYVAVHLHSAHATVEGGVVINIATLDQTDPAVWCDMQGIDMTDGRAVVYKAVTDDLTSGRGLAYPIGSTVVADDWRPDGECGGGLHFGPTPRHARDYHPEATRYLACSIPVDAASGIPGGTSKIKARECVVLHEVDLDGKPLAVEAAS